MSIPVLRQGVLLAGAVAVALAPCHAGAALVAYWSLNNTTDNAVVGGPVGALGGNAAFSTDHVAPVAGGTHSAVFDGTGSNAATDDRFYVGATHPLKRALESDFTVSLWARSNVGAADLSHNMAYLWDIGESHTPGMGVAFNRSHGMFPSGKIAFYHNDAVLNSGVDGQADTWYHVAVTRSGNDYTMYVTPESESTVVANRSISLRPLDSRYGFEAGSEAKNHHDRQWDGFLDDISIWHRALSAADVAQLAAGLAPDQLAAQMPTTWRWEIDTFDHTQSIAPNQAVGPWRDGARWRYQTVDSSQVSNHNYSTADIALFEDLDSYSGDRWRKSGMSWPDVDIVANHIHPGNQGTDDQSVVIAWEADFDGFIDIDYRVWSGNSPGYQLLQWDHSGEAMRVLQQRRTYSSGDSGELLERTRVEPGDRILFVYDADGNGSNDRANFRQTITVGQGPRIMEDRWVFADETFNATGLDGAAGPWNNSARWRYMTSADPQSPDHAYTALGELADFQEFAGGNTWRNAGETHPSVRISDLTLHAGADRPAIVSWEADFAGMVDFEYLFESNNPTNATVGYQVLQWNASEGLMESLFERETATLSEEMFIDGQTRVGIGDHVLFLLDSLDGNHDNDRVAFSAMFTAVPEPGAALLALWALVCGLLVRRRARGAEFAVP